MLNQKVLTELKNKLIAEKDELEKELQKIANQENGEYETKFEDLGRSSDDNAEEVEEYTTNLGIVETLEKKLTEVNKALERISNDTYGRCENCSEEIPLERLQVYPSATVCIKCKK